MVEAAAGVVAGGLSSSRDLVESRRSHMTSMHTAHSGLLQNDTSTKIHMFDMCGPANRQTNTGREAAMAKPEGAAATATTVCRRFRGTCHSGIGHSAYTCSHGHTSRESHRHTMVLVLEHFET
mmetsp:Transcript_22534/g.39776  ORF Transcript_22534/g.39776 Transcript_22534/m.39776 type:complete len:123 (-) Transcript_22534:51-419(-)